MEFQARSFVAHRVLNILNITSSPLLGLVRACLVVTVSEIRTILIKREKSVSRVSAQSAQLHLLRELSLLRHAMIQIIDFDLARACLVVFGLETPSTFSSKIPLKRSLSRPSSDPMPVGHGVINIHSRVVHRLLPRARRVFD